MSRTVKPDSRLIVRPHMNLESSSADAFRKALLKAVKQRSSNLVIDLSQVDTIDSIGLGVFIATYNTLARKGKKLEVINASQKIRSLFQSMGLVRRFKVHGKDSGAGRES